VPATLASIFLDAVEARRGGPLFRRKVGDRWETISADRTLADVESLALGLAERGVLPGDRVALLSESRHEWAVSDLAILCLRAVTVPLYPTLTAAQCGRILANSEPRVLIVSSAEQLAKARELLPSIPSLDAIVCLDAEAREAKEHSYTHVSAAGAARRAAESAGLRERAGTLRPDDLATIIYTSGTTGEPKGAMLTHGNIASNVESCLQIVSLGPSDVSLSFLPLCHVFERMGGLYAMMRAGVTIAFAQSMDTVAADALEVRPTVLTGVPRFFEKVHARVVENVRERSGLQQRMFQWGQDQGARRARAHFAGRKHLSLRGWLADRLVTAKVRDRMGGRLRFCVSGGAPLNPHVMEFFFAIGIPVVEGYGLTETSPVICLNPLGRERPGSVGPPIPGVEVRIGEEGEILTRGPHVMKGYYRDEAATRAAIRDGWFHTGDVGRLDADGYLFITDRLKDLLVLAGGKKVAPQPIEAKLKQSPLIEEAVLIGDTRPYVVALIVPRFARLEAEAAAGGASSDRLALLARPETLALIQAEIDRVNADLAPFETIKRFALLDHELTQESGAITPTLKVKRRVVLEQHKVEIDTLYVGHEVMRGEARAS
jgi:long-chain acyl-CoA synthetase